MFENDPKHGVCIIKYGAFLCLMIKLGTHSFKIGINGCYFYRMRQFLRTAKQHGKSNKCLLLEWSLCSVVILSAISTFQIY
jgi:hypothetical protein